MGTENCDSKIGVQWKKSSVVNEIRKCPLISVFFMEMAFFLHVAAFLSPLIMLFYFG